MSVELTEQRPQVGARLCRVVIHPQVRQHKGPHQPRPHRPLMVSSVTLPLVSAVPSDKAWHFRREAAQSVRGQKVLRAYIDDARCCLSSRGV
jgi:hypothetical protein